MATGRSGFETAVVKQCPFIWLERERWVSPMCVCVCVCFTMPTQLHYYALGIPVPGGYMALSAVYFRFTHRLGRPHYVWDEYLYGVGKLR